MLEHNKIVYEEVIERLKTSSRVCIVQATGTGKGVIASSLIEDYVKVLVVAPTNAILENYRMNLGVNSENVIFYTYQGISMLLNNQIEELGEKVSLIILDEFHRIGAETWGRKVEMLCDRAESKGCKTVGLSATPVRYLDNERDMSEEFFKGNVVNGLNIVDAVVSGVLPTFKYVVSYYGYEKDLFKKLEERKEKVSNEIKQIVSNLENNYSIGKIIQKETNELSNNQKWIVFFSKIEELEEFKDKIYSWFNGKVNIFILHSQSNYSGNMKVLKEFNNSDKDINVLLSVNMLNEGVHIKDIDGVIMMRKTISPIVYLQQLGRALQIGGKNPIIFDFIGNIKRIDKHDNFSLSVIEEINNKLNLDSDNNIVNEKKIIISGYCENISEILREIESALYPEKFTEFEDNIIIKYYPIGGPTLCIENGLNRKSHSIKERAYKLGVHCLRGIDKWTEEEINILKEYYEVGGVKLCKENGLVNKEDWIITRIARSLGLNYLRKRSWTNEEDEIIKKYYPISGVQGCIDNGIKNRGKHGIYGRAKKLGVFFEKSIWEDWECEILKKYYPLGGSKLCINKGLNKSKSAISNKASAYNLYFSNNSYSEAEDNIIREYYPLGGSKLCIDKGLNRSEHSIAQRAHKLNIVYTNVKSVNHWSELEVEILRKYYPIGGVKLCKENGLNRPDGSIRQSALRYGVSENRKNKLSLWSDKEKEILKKYYHIGGVKLCQENGLSHRDKDSIRGAAERYGLYGSIVNFWTDEEEEILKKYYPIGGVKLCQENGLNNRPEKSISAKAHRLGLKHITCLWTEEEINILKENYFELGENIVELLPNRSWVSIKGKAVHIGLRTKAYGNIWSEEEINLLRENFLELGKNIVELFPDRNWDSIRRKALSLGIKRDDYKKVIKWSSEEEEIIRKYYPIESAKIVNRLPNRTLGSIRKKAESLGIKVK